MTGSQRHLVYFRDSSKESAMTAPMNIKSIIVHSDSCCICGGNSSGTLSKGGGRCGSSSNNA